MDQKKCWLRCLNKHFSGSVVEVWWFCGHFMNVDNVNNGHKTKYVDQANKFEYLADIITLIHYRGYQSVCFYDFAAEKLVE